MAEENQQQNNQQLQPEAQTSNKRIAKNTVLLYIRMIVMIIIGLYTSRVVLQVLGVKDYGVFNAVGGIVAMFSILSNSLSTAVSRYLTFELGKGDIENLKKVFSTSMNVQLLIATIIFIVGGIVGGWFLNCKMNIPPERIIAANWVLFCSLFSFGISLISVPYTASIISHEKMNMFAYMTILEAVLKLLIVFLLFISPYDKLISYAILLLIVSILIRFCYSIYCKKKFIECHYNYVMDIPLFKEMTKFAGWNFLGNASWTFNTHGINILINLFFGVTVNAARGIATQVESLVIQLVNNFMTALTPQITKSYASGDLFNMHNLIVRGAKFSFFLLMFLAIPFCFETEKLLSLWLGIIPEYTVTFVRLTFVSSICTVLGNTLVTAQLATGRIKKYQIVMTLCGIWVFPLTYIAFYLKGGPSWSYIIFIIIYFGLIFVRLFLVKDLINMPMKVYIKEVFIKCVIVLFLSLVVPALVFYMLPESFLRLVILFSLSFIYSSMVIYFIGLDRTERMAVKGLLKKSIKKH